ncbi:MAG: hypothetical protein CVU00_03595 [Bacteroidetes bacterium HGW-Bacteroidetes-17]|jgi:hypothetical protein|nr:MAG: hypothetical protein CVU00_03595 [Bacteroidetes bacterium HGW-Bacteroidetes-17]
MPIANTLLAQKVKISDMLGQFHEKCLVRNEVKVILNLGVSPRIMTYSSSYLYSIFVSNASSYDVYSGKIKSTV